MLSPALDHLLQRQNRLDESTGPLGHSPSLCPELWLVLFSLFWEIAIH